MLMVPTGNPAGRFVDLPNDAQFRAATVWGRSKSPAKVQRRALEWMNGMKIAGRPVLDFTPAFEAIAWAQEMPQLEKILESKVWLALGEVLSNLADEVDQRTVEDSPVIHQFLGGELAWTLATRLPQAPFSGRLERSGRAAITLGFSQILDRQGMLPAESFGYLRHLLACWTNCRALAAELPRNGFGPRLEQRYQRFVRNALRCTRPDGHPMFAADYSWEWSPWGRHNLGQKLFEAVLKSSADEIGRNIAASALPRMSPGVAKPPKKTADLPPASLYCEDRAVAVMRRNWNRNDERIAALFAGTTCNLELVASGRVAACGAWRFEITQQGQQLQPVSDWESNCWYSDEDVDYLELEIELTAGVKLQRQIVLAREDRFLFLADAVMSPQAGNLEYRGVLPLAPQIEFQGAVESQEGLLVEGPKTTGSRKSAAGRPLAHVIPLALPEWRAEQGSGELTAIPRGIEPRQSEGEKVREYPISGGLELRQTSAGQRLFAPLFIDLDRHRFRRRMTWRRLTVAEWLEPVPPDVAVGFRVALGDQQWIIYRSLAASSNRTLLGHNLATESLIARFGKDGEVTSIVEIE